MGRQNLTVKHRRRIHARDGGRCKKCRTTHQLEVHHIVERVQGGGDEDENLDTLCAVCHGEWTWSPPHGVEYAEWLTLPPAWMFALAAAKMMRARAGAGVADGAESATFAGIVDAMLAVIRGQP